MNSRLVALTVSAAMLASIVVVVLVTGGGDGSDTPEELTKPEVEVPEGPPPDELVVEDLEEGDGTAAAAGDQITVQYVGVDYETGEEFDSSYGNPEPFSFALGTGAVIPGWDEGIEGMKEGGQRQLVIPPDLAYGEQGQPPAIGPDATLVFVVDLVSVE